MRLKKLVLALMIGFLLTPPVKAETPLKAAFVREQQLWLKEGNHEIQLTKNQNVTDPKWSTDGRFIAYLNERHLYVYDTMNQDVYQPYDFIETDNFKWSPLANELAYTSGTVLNVTKMENGRPGGFENVALGVRDFEWFLDGKSFVVSTEAAIKPTGWAPIELFKVPVDANLDRDVVTSFYTIPSESDDFFIIEAKEFKWSADGKWLSFLGGPTASLSMDSNTLFVLSAEGTDFQVIGNMLGYETWVKWAPEKNQLVFIEGEGRFFVENKHATLSDIPKTKVPVTYTPAGFVDLDLAWLTADELIVARAKENKTWKEGSVPTMFTSLYVINLITKEQTPLTAPATKKRDVAPQVIGDTITWFRSTGRNERGDVWLKEGLQGNEQLWLKNIDAPPVFYQ